VSPGVWSGVTTSTGVSLLGTGSFVNNKRCNIVASYCFAPVAGYSSFGSYTGNGSTDGPFVYTGFRPRWVLVVNVSERYSRSWFMLDTARFVILTTLWTEKHLIPKLEAFARRLA
jgi:hypothetical protein